MANIDATVDEVFQQWDDQKLKLQKVPLEGQEGKFGPWVKLIGQRQALFAERWRPDRMKVLKKLGNQNNATVESVRGVLTPVAEEDPPRRARHRPPPSTGENKSPLYEPAR